MNKLTFFLLASLALVGCAGSNDFADLDRFMKEIDAKPRGRIEPLPEVQVYKAFQYSAANRRSPFLPPAEVVLNEVRIQQDQSNVKPDLDRPREVLESFSLTQLRMVGTLQRGENNVLWALLSDNEGSVHMAKEGQYMGKNHGRIVSITDGLIELIEIVPNGHGGWLEKPRTVALEDE